jgi:hypothetical protein
MAFDPTATRTVLADSDHREFRVRVADQTRATALSSADPEADRVCTPVLLEPRALTAQAPLPPVPYSLPAGSARRW